MKVMLSLLPTVCDRPPGRNARSMSKERGDHGAIRPIQQDYCCKIAITLRTPF